MNNNDSKSNNNETKVLRMLHIIGDIDNNLIVESDENESLNLCYEKNNMQLLKWGSMIAGAFLIAMAIFFIVKHSFYEKADNNLLNNDNIDSNNGLLSQNVDFNDNIYDCMEPPAILYFKTFEDVKELFSFIYEEDENKIIDYLEEKNYYMNGISSKDDLINVYNKIKDLQIMYIDDNSIFPWYTITYYIDYGIVEIGYYDNSQMWKNEMMEFRCYLKDSDFWEDTNNKLNNDAHSVESIYLQGDEITMYRSTDESGNYIMGQHNTSNSHITIVYKSLNRSSEISENIKTHIKISTIGEIIDSL